MLLQKITFINTNEILKMDLERDLPLVQYKPFVKLYSVLQETSQSLLMDQGFISIINEEVNDEKIFFIEILSKVGEQIYKTKLQKEISYEKQAYNFILWKESPKENSQTFAMQFQTQNECNFILYMLNYFREIIWEKMEIRQQNQMKQIEVPTQNNLANLLDALLTDKDYFSNAPIFQDFFIRLHKLYEILSPQPQNDHKIILIYQIIKGIFNTIQHRYIEFIFSQPIFSFLLQLQTRNKRIDFMRLWKQHQQIKKIMTLNEEIVDKIMIIHKISFFRENILDLMTQHHLQHALILVEIECTQDLIQKIIKGNLIDEVSKLDCQMKDIQIQNQPPRVFNIEQQNQFLINKFHFVMQAIILAKKINQTVFRRFIDKIYQSNLMQMIYESFDKNIVASLDFLICLAKCDPFKLINYLKEKYREKPSQNLHQKLTKKYCTVNEQVQSSILQIIKYLNESFFVKQNLDFFLGTFFTYVFLYCTNEKGLILILSELIEMIENIQPLLLQALKSRVFSKIIVYLRNLSRDKMTELKALKIMKRILLENVTQNKQYKQVFLRQINNEMINCGYFDYCLVILAKNIHFNNILSSSMLQNLKIISQYRHFTPYHHYIQTNAETYAFKFKSISDILQMKPQEILIASDNGNPESHLKQLQQEKQEEYFMKEINDELSIQKTISETQTKMQSQEFKRYREVMLEMQRQAKEEEGNFFDVSRKRVKQNQSMEQSSCMINLAFDDEM